MKQKKNSSYCVACVAAMATNTTVAEFREFLNKKKGPYNDFDFYKYLVSKHYAVGVGFTKNGIDLKDKTAKCIINLSDYPAYVIVESQTKEKKLHAIYWDGKKVHDPNPAVKDGCELESYEIVNWFPITK